MEPEIDIIRHVYSEDSHYITVRPWPDSPDVVCLCTDTNNNEEYYGVVNITMSPKMATKLGEALIACANEINGDGK